MIKQKLGDRIDGWIHSIFPFLFRRPLNPNVLTVIGAVGSLVAAAAFAVGWFVTGGILVLASGFFDLATWLTWTQVVVALGLVIFVHELGHFLVAKWAGVRVDKFCVGFGRELFGFTRGRTRYSFNILPLGGYVKMAQSQARPYQAVAVEL